MRTRLVIHTPTKALIREKQFTSFKSDISDLSLVKMIFVPNRQLVVADRLLEPQVLDLNVLSLLCPSLFCL